LTIVGVAFGTLALAGIKVRAQFADMLASEAGAAGSFSYPSAVVPAATSDQAIPASAAAARFTTLAFNSDFTEQLPANWLGGCPVAGNGRPVLPWNTDNTGHIWWQNIWWAKTYLPCQTVQVQDVTYGGLVLDMPWVVDARNGKIGNVIQSMSEDGVTANDLPPNFYLEYTIRVTPLGDGRRGPYTVLNTWPTEGGARFTQAVGYEVDVAETSASFINGWTAGTHNWGTGFAAFAWAPFSWSGSKRINVSDYDVDITKYNTFGARMTSDGSTAAEACFYINNIFVNCQNVQPSSDFGPDQYGHFGNNFAQRLFLVLQGACENWNNACLPDGTLQHVYVKSVRAWSCANWRNGDGHACDRPVLTGPP
jgi:hypothetical protein